jgi:hypothetical protein
MISTNTIFDLAAAFVLQTNRHLFLTGRAGTGKTTFLKYIEEHTPKNTVIVAPTGVAAINAGGVTMHSLFQLPFGSFIPVRQPGFSSAPSQGTDLYTLLKNMRLNREKRQLMEEMELLVIDEVSMLRADLLDAMDGILRHVRKKLNTPFGGVQVLYIGDLYQLPPVVSNDEWSFLSQYYKTMFFFDALVLREARPLCIELDKIYRQSDAQFIDLLNNIRNNEATDDDLRLLQKYYDPFFYPDPDEGYILLTSHNYKADKINQQALAMLQGDPFTFEGEVTGEFNEKVLPADKSLTLKVGAQIMFIRNDKGDQRRYYNGKIGIISRIKDKEVYIRFPGSNDELQLEHETWRNIRYAYNEPADKIIEEELGSYKQFPIRLAWAVTIHKSQGLTFEKAIVDAGQSFAPGQVYVALSRLTSLKGLVLASEITPPAIQTDERIVSFARMDVSVDELERELLSAQKEYMLQKLADSFNWIKLSESIKDHHASYSGQRLPNQAEAVEWSAGMLRKIMKLGEVGERFTSQLRQLSATADEDGYQQIAERVKAAGLYFIKEINEQLLHPYQKHYDETRVKSKVKKYLKMLEWLKLLLTRKKHQIENAVQLVLGMQEGKQVTTLLNSYQLSMRIGTGTAIDEQHGEGKKSESRVISLEMLQEGKTIDEIATERALAKSTIEGHLVSFVSTGEVSLRQLINEETELAIRNAIRHSSERNAGAIRAALGNTFSYPEIRAVLYEIEKEELRDKA